MINLIKNKALYNNYQILARDLLSKFSRAFADKIIKVPHLADSISEGTLKSWTKQEGEQIEQDEEIATLETDKIDIPVNSPVAGVIKKHLAKEEDIVIVGQDLFIIAQEENSTKTPEPKKEIKKEVPVVNKEENQQDKKKVETINSKPKSSNDKPAELIKSKSQNNTTSLQKVNTFTSPQENFFGRTETRVKMNRMRLRIADRLKEAQNTAASLTTFNEVDMSALMNLRKAYKDQILKQHNVKFGFMSAFLKASTIALQEIPTVNAAIEGLNGGDTIVYRDYVDISVAVATSKGLVTPIVRNVDKMSFIQIEKIISLLGSKARDNKLTLEDLSGGTFTISNGGVFGSLMGTPIINLPQTAILGMHAIKDRPIALNGQIVIKPMMYLALTYDHRLIDGREAVSFLIRVKEIIEDPQRILLDI